MVDTIDPVAAVGDDDDSDSDESESLDEIESRLELAEWAGDITPEELETGLEVEDSTEAPSEEVAPKKKRSERRILPAELRTKSVQPLLLRVDVAALPEEVRTVYGLTLSNKLINGINALQFDRKVGERKHSGDTKYPRFVMLQQALQSLAAEIITFSTGVFKFNEKERPPYWLFTDAYHGNPLKESSIRGVVQRWLRLVFIEAAGAFIAENIKDEDFQWSKLDIAELIKREDVNVAAFLPALLARHMVRNKAELIFRGAEGVQKGGRLFLAPGSSPYGVQLITMPADTYLSRESREPYEFSYYLRLRTVSLPGSTDCLVSANTGVSRWVRGGYIRKGASAQLVGRNTSHVYIQRPQASWASIRNEEDAQTLIQLGIKQYKDGPQWEWGMPQLLDKISGHDGSIPSAPDFLANPNNYPKLHMVYNTRMSRTHTVGAGVEQIDRWEAFLQVESLMPSGVQAAQPWGKIEEDLVMPPPFESVNRGRKLTAEGLARNSSAQTYTIELCSAHPEGVVAALQKLLPDANLALGPDEQSSPTGQKVYARLPGLQLVSSRLDPSLWSLLDERVLEDKRVAVRERFELFRADDIENALPKAQTPVGVLVEMPNYQEGRYEERLRDPKDAVRLGLVRTRRLSQFFTPPERVPQGVTSESIIKKIQDRNSARLSSALLDLLRQLGYAPYKVYRPAKRKSAKAKAAAITLPDNLDLLALQVFRLKKRPGHDSRGIAALPVVMHIQPGEPEKWVYLPAKEGFKRYGLRDAQLELARMTASDEGVNDDEGCRMFFMDVLDQLNLGGEGEQERDSLLLVPFDTLASVLPELTDEVFSSANMRVPATFGRVLDNHPNMRVARVRYSSKSQVPAVTGYPEATADSPHYEVCFGKFNGLFSSSVYDGVFYSIQTWPSTQQKKNGLRQADYPSRTSWNPGACEIVVTNLHKSDVPSQWAWLTHKLRLETPHFSEAAALPEPLHSLTKIKEYVLRLEEEGEDEEENAAEE